MRLKIPYPVDSIPTANNAPKVPTRLPQPFFQPICNKQLLTDVESCTRPTKHDGLRTVLHGSGINTHAGRRGEAWILTW